MLSKLLKWLLSILGMIAAAVVLIAWDYSVEARYEPCSITERMIGFFLLPSDFLTGRESAFHPQDVILHFRRTGESSQTDEELARKVKTSTLEALVQRLDLGPENVFRRELHRRTKPLFSQEQLAIYAGQGGAFEYDCDEN